ncbi:hypothetical protein ACRAKI_05330 [Saccharothrix isguenensis]
MGMYVAVRGWIEFDNKQRRQVEEILAEHRDHALTWTIRDGLVGEAPAPGELRWFAERP